MRRGGEAGIFKDGNGAAAADPSPQRWYKNPYLQLGLTALLIAAAEIFLKLGATFNQDTIQPEILGVEALNWRVTWIGIVFHILGFVGWLSVLRVMPLVEAFALLNVVHVIVPVASSVFLGERISPLQGLGITLVIAGAFLAAASASRASEQL